MPQPRVAQRSPADWHRMARWPSYLAPHPRAALAPVEPNLAADSLAEIADLSECVYAGGVLVGATLSGRAFVSLAGHFAPLRQVRLVALDPVLEELAACPHLAAVEELSLAGCQIGDAGLERLVASRHFIALKHLNIRQNGITDGGIAALENAAWMGQLQELNLVNNPVSAATIERFGVRFPDLRIQV